GLTSFLIGETEPDAVSIKLSAHTGDGHLAEFGCTPRSGVGEIIIAAEEEDQPQLGEAARLFLRLAVKLHGPDVNRFRVARKSVGVDDIWPALSADGVLRGAEGYELRHRTGGFGREEKAAAYDMDEVYSDPLTVPWN